MGSSTEATDDMYSDRGKNEFELLDTEFDDVECVLLFPLFPVFPDPFVLPVPLELPVLRELGGEAEEGGPGEDEGDCVADDGTDRFCDRAFPIGCARSNLEVPGVFCLASDAKEVRAEKFVLRDVSGLLPPIIGYDCSACSLFFRKCAALTGDGCFDSIFIEEPAENPVCGVFV